MRDELIAIQQEIDGGQVTAQSLVSLYNEATDAGQRLDSTSLAHARALAERLTETVSPELRDDARRLVEFCDELFRAAPAPAPNGEPAPATCPDCGRELIPNAIRCRGCGERFI